MKMILSIINIILLAVIYITTQYHFDFKEPSPDKALDRTPEQTDKFSTIKAKTVVKPVRIKEITGNNPFHPQRGKQDIEQSFPLKKSQPEPPRQQPQFELIGICELGDTTGAIIVKKGLSRRSPTPTSSRRHSFRSRSETPAPIQNQKRFFKLNDEVGDGYKLVAVTRSSAILQSSSDQIELKIEHARFELESKSTLPSPATRNSTAKTPVNSRSNPRASHLQYGSQNLKNISTGGNNKK